MSPCFLLKTSLAGAVILLVFLLSGCVRPEVQWPPKSGSHTLVLVGPFHEAQMEKGSRLNRVLEEVIHDFVRNPETLLGGQSHIHSVINERFIWVAERQQDEWGTLKEMSRHPQVDPARVLAVLDVAEFRKTHNRLEAGLRLHQEPGDDTPVLEGYLYATRTEVPLGKARWFS